MLDHVARSAAAGADEILLADTIGAGVPGPGRRLVPRRPRARPASRSACTCTTLATPATRTPTPASRPARRCFDASIGGLGGCPFAPRATGNIATEDLVYLLDGLGVEHGCDLDELIRVSEWLEAVLGHDLPGLLHRAGGFPA